MNGMAFHSCLYGQRMVAYIDDIYGVLADEGPMAATASGSRLVFTSYKLMAGFWIQLMAWSILIRPAVSENLQFGKLYWYFTAIFFDKP